VFANIQEQIISKFVQIHVAKLPEVETFVGSHNCEVENIGQLDLYIFNFFLQVNLVQEMPSEYVLFLLGVFESLAFFDFPVDKSLAVLEYFVAT